MQQPEVIKILKKDLNFDDLSIEKLKKFSELVFKYNLFLFLISNSTEKSIWFRHILDSAQILRFIDFRLSSLAV